MKALQLISKEVSRKLEIETSKKGLVIVSAKYGSDNEITEGRFNSNLVIDVSQALQYMVNDSRLIIPSGTSKSKYLGFYDPCPDKNKKLIIRYLYQEILHEWIFEDLDEINLPQRFHRT